MKHAETVPKTVLRSNFVATLLALLAVMPLAVAQNAAPIESANTPVKPRAFEVVSIRRSRPDKSARLSGMVAPDGYRGVGESVFRTIMIAYFPQGPVYWTNDRLSGAPTWLDDKYEIDAKVSDADLAEWQKQGTTQDKQPMLREMLQAMLADRCHLIAHMAPGPPLSGCSLEPGKHTPHLTESKPDETLPAGGRLPDGGVTTPYQRGQTPRLTFYGASMGDLAHILAAYAGHPVQDRTGLTGRYDFVVTWVSDPDSRVPEGAVSRDDPDPLSHWNIDALGLRAVPVKLPTQTLVIDHIERPSEN